MVDQRGVAHDSYCGKVEGKASRQEMRDFRQMMIIVFCNEVQMVDKAHWLPQAGM